MVTMDHEPDMLTEQRGHRTIAYMVQDGLRVEMPIATSTIASSTEGVRKALLRMMAERLDRAHRRE
jgi:hypothetical protein